MPPETRTQPGQDGLGRTCLLKGCGKSFVPRPQDLLRAKYCSSPCRKKAARWRAWLRRKRWRRSPRGKEAKQNENHRYRKSHPDYPSRYRKRKAERVRAIERASKHRQRSRDAEDSGVHKGVPCCQVPCHRPGCYRLFLTWVSLALIHRYCGPACSEAMRRYRALLAQLRYRRTPLGNYRRKLSRFWPRSPPGGALDPAPPH